MLTELESEDFYNREYYCTNKESFRDILLTIENKCLSNDIKLKSFNDYCNSYCIDEEYMIAIQKGNGVIVMKNIPKTIVESGNIELMKKLIQYNKKYLNQIEQDWPTLSYAIHNDQYELAKFLLDNNADPNKTGHRNKTPLYYAIVSRNEDIIEAMLVKGANPYLQYSINRTNYFDLSLSMKQQSIYDLMMKYVDVKQ
jgi:ankyrin repeat protein